MATYVVATRQEAQTGSLIAEDYVREVSGVWIRGGTDLTGSRSKPPKSPRPRLSTVSEACFSSSRSLRLMQKPSGLFGWRKQGRYRGPQ